MATNHGGKDRRCATARCAHGESSDAKPLAATSVETPFIIASYNVGLTTDFVLNRNGSNSHLYTFTKWLAEDLVRAFHDEGAHALFLCELGSMKEPHKIDRMFSERAALPNSNVKPLADITFCDRATSLDEYMHALLSYAGLGNLRLSCAGPYACIFDSDWLEMVGEPKVFGPWPGNPNRIAMAYAFAHRPTGLDVNVVCCHSPSSKNWDDLKKGVERNTIFQNCVSRAGGTKDNRSPKRWVVCGDLNTDPGLLKRWSSVYWANNAAPCAGDDPLALRVEVAKHHRSTENGDCTVSQGLFLLPDQSEIRQASDAHYMVVLKGFFADPVSRACNAPPLASRVPNFNTRVSLDSEFMQLPITSLPLQGPEPPSLGAALGTTQSSCSASPPADANEIPPERISRTTASDNAFAVFDNSQGPPPPQAQQQRAVRVHAMPTITEIDEHKKFGNLRGYQFEEVADVEIGHLQVAGETASISDPPGLNLSEIQQAPAPALDQTVPVNSISDAGPLAVHSVLPIEMVEQTEFGNLREHDFVGSDAIPLAARIVLQKLEEVADVDDGNAGGVLAELYSPEGRSSHAEVVEARLQALLATRLFLVTELAKANACFGTWTQQEWLEWYNTHELPMRDMTWALKMWQTRFEDTDMKSDTKTSISENRQKGTRESKAQARDQSRKAFRAWMMQTYGNASIAKAFLKFPTTRLDRVVSDWEDYKKTDEYQNQKTRSSKLTEEGLSLKLKLHNLRHRRRLAKLGRGPKAWNEYYRSGGLDQELAVLTGSHGFGRIYTQERGFSDMKPSTFEDFLACRD